MRPGQSPLPDFQGKEAPSPAQGFPPPALAVVGALAFAALFAFLLATVWNSPNPAQAQAQASPSVALELSSASVEEGNEITVTMSFSGLESNADTATKDYVFRADVVDSEDGDANECEDQAGGYGLGVDRYMHQVDENPEVRTGTISGGCPAGDYTIRASIASPENVELASARAGFTVAATAPETTPEPMPEPSVCDRTPQIRDWILKMVNKKMVQYEKMLVSRCEDVTSSHLAGVFGEVSTQERLLDDSGITSFKSGDFNGLIHLMRLNLSGNQLTSLPEGIFDKNPHLGHLMLNDNLLTSLPEGIFDENPALDRLELSDNRLTSLPEGFFDKNPGLARLHLSGNQLSSLPDSIFDGLYKLWGLDLSSNQLSSLPDSIFDNFSELFYLHLSDNQLSSLPEGMFEGSQLYSLRLSGNPGAPFNFRVEAELIEEAVDHDGKATARVRYKIAEGAPVLTTANLDVSGGEASTLEVTIRQGTLYSEEIRVTQSRPGQTVTLTLQDLSAWSTIDFIPNRKEQNSSLGN